MISRSISFVRRDKILPDAMLLAKAKRKAAPPKQAGCGKHGDNSEFQTEAM